jgi:hypothetical protein
MRSNMDETEWMDLREEKVMLPKPGICHYGLLSYACPMQSTTVFIRHPVHLASQDAMQVSLKYNDQHSGVGGEEGKRGPHASFTRSVSHLDEVLFELVNRRKGTVCQNAIRVVADENGLLGLAGNEALLALS